MLQSEKINKAKVADEISINATISQSYLFFMGHFKHFLRLAIIPIIFWVLIELGCDYALHEYKMILDPTVSRAIICAAFALVWYRQFLMGEKYATYSQLFDHVVSPGVFNIDSLLRSVARIIITTAILFVPTLMLSLSFMVYQFSQGVVMDQLAIQNVAIKSTSIVILLFSPILVRLSLYTVGVALGRRSMSLREVWHKTTGRTWGLWLLIFRAFLPITLYTYFITWAFEKIARSLDINYLWSSIIINVPTAFLTFMMLSIVVAVNGEAFRILVGIREKERI
ncbi:MAG: hypothetical protein KDF58_02710 [Alphaproteobacteria bacterium]|nr:hypothetical protein [Alphaproteobacteria bacterium]HRW29522.1 hypothetical protein [Emcibacteraceae bacterium]